VVLFLLLVVTGLSTAEARAASWQWYKSDTHVHGVVSGDALDDIGIISNAAKQYGYNAIFLTDHQAGSNFPISTVVANHVQFDDSFGTKWSQDTYGSLSSTTDQLVSSPIRQGASSLHLASTSNSAGETFMVVKRGPNLRSGDLILKFSVYPKRIDASAGVYASVSLGGDETVSSSVEGYTSQGGVISPGKSTVIVWQLGNARTASPNPQARVLTYNLPYVLNGWNDYVINITTGAATRNGASISIGSGGLNDIPAADRPLDYNALQQLKMSTLSTGGTADAYFDAYNLDASSAVPSGDEFAFRNQSVHAYDTSTYMMFPSIEMGYNRHAQRFNFPITAGAEYMRFFGCTDQLMTKCAITRGIDGILPTQQTGYPAQLNHPNLPGGVKLSEIVADNYKAFGADVIEVRPDPGGVPPTTMVDIWDSILQSGNVVLGTWSSDMHKVATLAVGERGVATYLYAPTLAFAPLMRSLFEGRMYLGRNTFNGRIIFNLDPSSPEPYPARYPVYVSDATASAPVHLKITDSIASGSKVRWLVNGSQTALDSASDSYEATKNISLSGPFSYVRAELHNPAVGSLDYIGMSEPIIFSDVPGLPGGVSFHVDAIDTPDGINYTKIFTKGITSTGWDTTAKSLSLTLTDPASSLVTLEADTSALTPQRVLVDGSQIPQAGSQFAFDTATTSTWYFDQVAHRLAFKALQPASSTSVRVDFGGSADGQPPSVPSGVTAAALDSNSIQLAWQASTDDVGVVGYHVYRDGATSPAATLTTGTSWTDSGLQPSSTHSYTVDAFDAAGNTSSKSSPAASATTLSSSTTTFQAQADSYVRSDFPTANNGTSTTLRLDATPTIRTFLRFNLSGLSGTVTKALLKLTATTTGTGYSVHGGVTDNSWSETGITYTNAPAFAATAAGTTGSFASGATTSVDVTSVISGNGLVTLVVDTGSTTAMSFSSREGASPPQLVVTTAGGGSVDAQPPSVPSGVTASALDSSSIQVSWQASTDNVGVVGYHVYRDGSTLPAATLAAVTSWTDTGLQPSSTHSYTVDAFDAAGNTSAQSSPPASATTQPASGGITTTTFSPQADATVNASVPGTNFGSDAKLRIDTSPTVQSYLRFSLSGLSGTVTRAVLRIAATSGGSGYEVHALNPPGGWTESALTYSTAPPLASAAIATAPSFALGDWAAADVTSLVSGNGAVELAVTGVSTTAASFSSREGASVPQLVVTTSS
jgi:hypothetical protein